MIDERSPWNHDYLVTLPPEDAPRGTSHSKRTVRPEATDADRKRWSEENARLKGTECICDGLSDLSTGNPHFGNCPYLLSRNQEELAKLHPDNENQ